MKYYIYLVSFFFFFSCKYKKDEIFLEGEKEIIQLNSIKRFDNINEIIPENFIISTSLIKLTSTHDDFLFKEINKIRLVNNQLFILDGRLNKLLVFGMDGISKSKIGVRGNGPNEYIDIADFDIDSDGYVYTIDGRLDKMYIYNPDFSLKSVTPLPFEADILSITEDNNIMFGLSAWNKGNNKGASIIITDKKLQTLQVLANYDEFVDNAFWVSHYAFVKTNNHIIYNKPISNNVILFSKKGNLEKVVEFDFGSNNVPLRYRKDIEQNIQKFNSYNLLKWITIVNDNYLIGTFWENRQTKSFFVNRETNEMNVTSHTIDRDIGNVAGFDGNCLIKFLIPGMERVYNNDLPKDIIEHLDNGDFVVLLYELKDNI